MGKIKVSIWCTTFNHVKYIKQALEGFIFQKCTFDYEIIIHDDCSTDGTIEILKEYCKRFPDRIKVIFEEVNKFHLNISYVDMYYTQISGEYIAFCEGDDFWIDPYKLQKQIDALEDNIDCSFSTSNAFQLTGDSTKLTDYYLCDIEEKSYSFEEAVGGKLFYLPSASMVFRMKDIIEKIENEPQYFKIAKVGDMPLQWYGYTKGKCYFINSKCVVYRNMADNSWSKQISQDKNKRLAHFLNDIEWKTEFNRWSNYKFNNIVEKSILLQQFNYDCECLSKAIFSKKYDEIFSKLPFKSKIGLFLKIRMNKLYKLLKG